MSRKVHNNQPNTLGAGNLAPTFELSVQPATFLLKQGRWFAITAGSIISRDRESYMLDSHFGKDTIKAKKDTFVFCAYFMPPLAWDEAGILTQTNGIEVNIDMVDAADTREYSRQQQKKKLRELRLNREGKGVQYWKERQMIANKLFDIYTKPPNEGERSSYPNDPYNELRLDDSIFEIYFSV